MATEERIERYACNRFHSTTENLQDNTPQCILATQLTLCTHFLLVIEKQ